jgi:hypothetical protein
MKRLVLFTAVLLTAVLILLLWPRLRDLDERPALGRSSGQSLPLAQKAAPNSRNDPDRSLLADELNAPTTDIRADLRVVATILDTDRTNFPATGNPVGSNAEITAALVGKNKLRLSLIPADHPAINRAGELCDRWGTPFFFHAESATQMGLRSAGPDRKMWNEDDVVVTP